MDRDFNQEHIRLLMDAFKEDPMFDTLFKGHKRHKQMKAFFRFVYIRNRLLNGVYLTDSKENPTYVGFVETPNNCKKETNRYKMRIRFEMFRLVFFIPLKSLQFLSKYDAITVKHRPNESHYYLTMVAVAPKYQGKGIGKTLINSIHNIVRVDANASSIYLDTENSRNVSYYESLGYDLVCEEKISNVSIYCMKMSIF